MCWSELSVRTNSGICKISLVVGIGLPTCVLQTYGIFFFFSVGMVIKLAWGCRGSKKLPTELLPAGERNSVMNIIVLQTCQPILEIGF